MKRAIVAVALLTVGCTPLRILNVFAGGPESARRTDLPYGPLPRQKLDVYSPDAEVSSAPVIVFFYGGSWSSGDRDEYEFVGETLRQKGYLVVIPDYRLSPEVHFPAFVEDAAKAVAWTQAHARELGGDPHRIVLAGHSAGAHLAMLVTLDRRYLRAAGGNADALHATVGLAGPYDFLPFTSESTRRAMGPQEGWPQTQPIEFARGDAPPLLLLHGTDDGTVKPGNSVRLAARIVELGGCARLTLYKGKDHLAPLAALASTLRAFNPDVADQMHGFIQNPGCTARTP